MLLCLGQGSRDMGKEPMLKTLAINPGDISPGFSPSRRLYTVRVPSTVLSVSLTATASDPDVLVAVNGMSVVSSQPSHPVSLAVGRNLIDVRASAPGGGVAVHYTIKVIRNYPTPTWVKVREESPWS